MLNLIIFTLKKYKKPISTISSIVGLCFFVNHFLGNKTTSDNIYVYRVLFRILIALCISYLLFSFTKSKNGQIKTIAYNLLFTILFLSILELLSFTYLTYINPSIDAKPSHILWYDNPAKRPYLTDKPLFYGDMDSDIGRWRLPNVNLELNRCSDNKNITYSSNSIGLRDKERENKSQKRIVVLGDSFTDGLWVNVADRYSNVMENNTQIEHINAGINGANPLVYSLIYQKKIIPRFQHDAIIVGLFLGNDFDTYKNINKSEFINYPIYRPYLAQKQDSDEIKYTLSNVTHSFENLGILKNPAILRKTRDSLFNDLNIFEKLCVEVQTNSYFLNLILHKSKQYASARQEKNYKSYFENGKFDDEQYREFNYSLKSIIDLAAGKKVIFVLIPHLNDIIAFKKSKINLAKKTLEHKYGSNNVSFIDLLPAFASYAGDPQNLYIACDGHWNEAGHKLAAETILKDPIYTKLQRSFSSK